MHALRDGVMQVCLARVRDANGREYAKTDSELTWIFREFRARLCRFIPNYPFSESRVRAPEIREASTFSVFTM